MLQLYLYAILCSIIQLSGGTPYEILKKTGTDVRIFSNSWTPLKQFWSSLMTCSMLCVQTDSCASINHNDKSNDCILLPWLSNTNMTRTISSEDGYNLYKKTLGKKKSFLTVNGSHLCMPYSPKPKGSIGDDNHYICWQSEYYRSLYNSGKTNCEIKRIEHYNFPGYDYEVRPGDQTFQSVLNRCDELKCKSVVCDQRDGSCYIKSRSHIIPESKDLEYSLNIWTYWYPDCIKE